MTYSDAIKLLRRKMIITQSELSKLLGVSFMSVSRWEHNVCNPTTKVKRRLASLFKEYEIEVKN